MTSLEIFNGDCLEVMKDITDNSIDLIICDLPYGCLSGRAIGKSAENKKCFSGNSLGCSWDSCSCHINRRFYFCCFESQETKI